MVVHGCTFDNSIPRLGFKLVEANASCQGVQHSSWLRWYPNLLSLFASSTSLRSSQPVAVRAMLALPSCPCEAFGRFQTQLDYLFSHLSSPTSDSLRHISASSPQAMLSGGSLFCSLAAFFLMFGHGLVGFFCLGGAPVPAQTAKKKTRPRPNSKNTTLEKPKQQRRPDNKKTALTKQAVA